MSKLWYISAALLGMVMHAFGLVLQKKGMDHLDFKRLKAFKVSHYFIIWFIGILLAYVISVLPTGIASKGLSPQIVSSISGLSIVLVVILSHYFLKERVFVWDIVLSIVIIFSIFGISIIKDVTPYTVINKKALYAMIFAPFLLLLPLLNRKAGNKLKTFEYAAFSGLTSGLCYVLLNIAVKASDGSFSGLFSTVYPYEYTAVGLFSTMSMQAAYRYGKIINIAPLQISLGVIYPLVCSYFIFQKSITPAQDLLIVVIAVCCAVIQKKH